MTYEESCSVNYASGKQCQKIPKKDCKYVQVCSLKSRIDINSIIDRFPSANRCLMRNVKRVMRTSARRHQDKLQTRSQDTDVSGPREHSLMIKDVEDLLIIHICYLLLTILPILIIFLHENLDILFNLKTNDY